MSTEQDCRSKWFKLSPGRVKEGPERLWLADRFESRLSSDCPPENVWLPELQPEFDFTDVIPYWLYMVHGRHSENQSSGQGCAESVMELRPTSDFDHEVG